MRVPKSNRTIEGTLDATRWLEEHPEIPPQLRHILCSYYKDNGRDFPWRRTSDPYKILIAEMLLRQTAVKPVVRVWTTFIQSYPDVKALANASVQDIEAIVSSLGLRKRATVLLELAQMIVQETGGEIIASAEFLDSLPGVGSYMASAVLSFAFNIKATTIDGSAGRLYTRICGFAPNTLPQSLAFARVVSEQVASTTTHKEVNYGVLDLAAQICNPNPLCSKCPVFELCQYAHIESPQQH